MKLCIRIRVIGLVITALSCTPFTISFAQTPLVANPQSQAASSAQSFPPRSQSLLPPSSNISPESSQVPAASSPNVQLLAPLYQTKIPPGGIQAPASRY